MTEFQAPKDGQGYDRVVSIEMFEHMKNYQALLKKVRYALWGGASVNVPSMLPYLPCLSTCVNPNNA